MGLIALIFLICTDASVCTAHVPAVAYLCRSQASVAASKNQYRRFGLISGLIYVHPALGDSTLIGLIG